VAFIMSEHIAVPSLTGGSDLPASVEPILAKEWLRGRLGFNGVLTSDDLWYAKMTDRFGAERTGVLAVRAGHDVLLKPAGRRQDDRGGRRCPRGRDPEAQIDDWRGALPEGKVELHRSPRRRSRSALSSARGSTRPAARSPSDR
jgi:beta-glucosidase-like glycosyl hydrolase